MVLTLRFGLTIGTQCPLNLIFTYSLIYRSGLSRQVSVANLFSKDGHAIQSVIATWGSSLPSLTDAKDRFCWRENSLGVFSMASAWELISVLDSLSLGAYKAKEGLS